MGRARRGVVVGVVVVVAYAALCVWAAVSAHNGALETGPAAAESFLHAWSRSRAATFALTATYERRSTAGAHLRSTVRVVQRPPDRLLFQFGGVTGRLDRRAVVCTSAPRRTCRLSRPGQTYAADARRQVAIIEQYVGGAAPRYTVEHDGDCYALRRVRGPAAAYGDRSRFCFDRATGAPVRIEVRNGSVVETSTASEVRRSVSKADFRLPGLGG